MSFNEIVLNWYVWLTSLNSALTDPILALSDGLGVPLISALLFGILGTTAPCQLSTNFGALAFLTRQPAERAATLRATIAYIVAKMLVYTVIGLLVFTIGQQVSSAIVPYATWIRKIIGPLMIVLGLMVLGLFKLRFQFGQRLSRRLEAQAEAMSTPAATSLTLRPAPLVANAQYALAPSGGSATLVAPATSAASAASPSVTSAVAPPSTRASFLLGLAFGLAFCPTLFILFFGATMSLALRSAGGMFFAPTFALGTVLPLLLLVGLALVSSAAAKRVRRGLRRANRPLRWLAGAVLILMGLHDTIIYWLI